MYIIQLIFLVIMKSILGIIKDGAPENDMVYSSDFKPIAFKHFVILNLVLNIAKKEKINKINFIQINNFKKMSNVEVKSFLDQYDLIVQYSNKYENSIDYILNNQNKFIFLESPVVHRDVSKPLISQKYFRVMTGNHLGVDFIKKYNQNKIRYNFDFPNLITKNSNGDSILIINQMVNDSAIYPTHPYEWALETIKEIRKYSNDNIIFRDHPLQKENYKPEVKNILNYTNIYLSENFKIEDDLDNSRCCITFSSGSAIESLLYGVPVVATDKRSFVYEIVENDFGKINNLKIPNLNTLKSSLSFTHYSFNEILDGTCWENIKKFI